MAGAALAAVGGAMMVLGLLDAMGVVRLMGSSPLFLGVCAVMGGGFLVLVSRAESVGEEEDPVDAIIDRDPDDMVRPVRRRNGETFGDDPVAGRIGPGSIRMLEGPVRRRRK